MLTFSGIGRLTKDPVSRNAGETTVCRFSMAFNKKIGDKEYTDYFDFEAWGKGGEVIQKWCQKGDQLFVAGQPRQEKWEKDGETRYGVSFRVNDFTLVGGNKSPSAQANQTQTKQQEVVSEESMQEVPF
jgi:single-strand DNA-binding protein